MAAKRKLVAALIEFEVLDGLDRDGFSVSPSELASARESVCKAIGSLAGAAVRGRWVADELCYSAVALVERDRDWRSGGGQAEEEALFDAWRKVSGLIGRESGEVVDSAFRLVQSGSAG